MRFDKRSMEVSNPRPSERYTGVAQLLHWVIAALFVVQFGLAWYMEALPNTPHKVEMFNLHKSFGLTILALAVIRLAWRLRHAAPAPPGHMARWERIASHASHILLYAILFLQPLTGLALSLFSRFPTVVFYSVTIPPIAHVGWLKDATTAAHWYGSWIILGLIGVHVAAAVRHHFFLRDEVLLRMLPGGGTDGGDRVRRTEANK